MTSEKALSYAPAMFASCMLFQTLYVLCVLLWLMFPELSGHLLLTSIFPQFRLLDLPNFIDGLILSATYGWFVAAVFVFFYNLWPSFLGLFTAGKAASQAAATSLPPSSQGGFRGRSEPKDKERRGVARALLATRNVPRDL